MNLEHPLTWKKKKGKLEIKVQSKSRSPKGLIFSPLLFLEEKKSLIAAKHMCVKKRSNSLKNH